MSFPLPCHSLVIPLLYISGMPRTKSTSAQSAPAKKKSVPEKSVEASLWESANKLRGSVEPAEYKHVVLSLIFLKFASDKFEEQREKLIAAGRQKYVEMPEFYNKDNVFYLEETSRWSFIIEHARQSDIALLIDTALANIEKKNKALRGALPDNYFSRLQLDTAKLAALISDIDGIDTIKDKEQDVVGRVYEYFLGKFAIAEGKGKGEFYTPKTIVGLIAEMIEPYRGKIYDPCCGSGGMFVQSMKFIEAHHGNKREVSVYGQEYTGTTYKLAKMNLAIRGISGNLGDKPADTFAEDQHKDLKADFIMANPPFNQKSWRAENELLDDPRWKGYTVLAHEQRELRLDSEHPLETLRKRCGRLFAQQRRAQRRRRRTANPQGTLAERQGRGNPHSAPQHVLLHRHQRDALDSEQQQDRPRSQGRRFHTQVP